MQMLVADHSPDFFLEALEQRGFIVQYVPDLPATALHEYAGTFDAILIKSALVLNAEFFAQNPSLQWILRPGSGLDNVDLDAAKARGVKVLNSPEGNCNAVGEHVLGALLSLHRYLPKAMSEVRNGQWIREANRGIELEHRSVAIIGVGHTGGAVAQKLLGFNVKLLPHDKYKPFLPALAMNAVPLEKVFAEADVVTLHLPLNQETHYYADEAFFNAFHKPITFINASRGKVLQTAALLKALKQGRVISAALDVLETEPLHKASTAYQELVKQLLDTQKVLITPHIAGWTHEAKRKMFAILIEKYDQLNESPSQT